MMKRLNKFLNLKKTIPELIYEAGAVPGIKVDTGVKILAGSPEEKLQKALMA